MPRTQQVINSFSTGVLSPRLTLRTDSDKYASALQTAINFIVSPQGGITFREGFENIAPTSVLTDKSKIFTFYKGGNESDMLVEVVSDGFIYFWIDGVRLSDTVPHDWLLEQFEDLYFSNSEVTGVFCHADYPSLYIEIGLDGVITGAPLPSAQVPLADYRDANSPTASTTISADYICTFIDGATETQWSPSRKWILSYDGVFAVTDSGLRPKEFEYSSTQATTINRLTKALERISALSNKDTSFSVVSSSSVEYTITILGVNAGKELIILPANPLADRYVSVENSLDESAVQEPAWSYVTYVLEAGDYYECILAHTSEAANQPPNTTFWTLIGATKPITFDYQYPDGNDWASGINYFPGGRGFPTVVVIHEQRMLLMANPGFTMGVFGSRINQYKDFVRGPNDDDPFFFAIDTSDTPTIRWAEAQQNLILGTSGGDYTLTAEITLTPTDVRALKQNNARAHAAKAVTINTEVWYIEQGREKVRSTQFIRDLQANSSTDISLIAENLLRPRVKRLALMQTPEVVIYGLREDGTLVCISYAPEQGVGAWYEFQINGTVVDITVLYSIINDEDELWAVITYNGTDYYLEKMPYPNRNLKPRLVESDLTLLKQGIVCMDGWIQGVIVEGDNNVISGLEQFEGLTVGAMVDDAWTGEYLVFDGSIILDAADIDEAFAGDWAVGLIYEGIAKTFEMVSGNDRGTGLGTKRKWTTLSIRLLDSCLPKVNGQLSEDRTPETLMGLPEIIREGLQDIKITNLGWGDGTIDILQDRPYPTHIIGMFGRFSSENA